MAAHILYLGAGMGDIAQANATGVDPDAFNAGSGRRANIHNAGSITVVASAVGWTSAHAVATGLIQTIDPPATATANFTNTLLGSFKVTAKASAATHATATANGIQQFVSATQKANAHVYNSGLIEVTAQATALAFATAVVNHGVQQSALGASQTAQAQIFNYASGTISIGAHALADGPFNNFANANITAGIQQLASSGVGNTPEVAHVSLSNQGNINIFAGATAESGINTNTANATITAGISQFARADSSALASILNGGAIGITAHGIAHGYTSASAQANVFNGIVQQAALLGTDQFEARALINNRTSGEIDIKAFATATVTGNFSAVATAYIQYGISQVAHGTNQARANITNLGSIDIVAKANATGASAYDVAKITSGIYQHASGSGVGDTATDYLVNFGGDISVSAKAVAHGQNQATAWGTLNYGIAQYALGANNAFAKLSNAGDIHLTAFAHATATNSAHAYADMVFGVFQSAHAFLDANAAARAVVNNTSGELGILVSARATASGPVSANAHLSNWGIFQSVGGGTQGHATIANGGTIDILVKAHAEGDDAYAQALIGSGTSAAGIAQIVTATNSAVASIGNYRGGQIGVTAQATAINTAAGAATANAWVSAPGISQLATGAKHAQVAIHNTSGTIAIRAIASASAPSGFASANAFIQTGIWQRAFTGATATPSFAKDVLTNNGEIDIIARATAKGASTANAHAAISYGISQVAIGGDTASDQLVNGGLLNIKALAQATGDFASATANMSNAALFQLASAGDDHLLAAAKITNASGGTIKLIDRATANGDSYAFAHANFTGRHFSKCAQRQHRIGIPFQ